MIENVDLFFINCTKPFLIVNDEQIKDSNIAPMLINEKRVEDSIIRKFLFNHVKDVNFTFDQIRAFIVFLNFKNIDSLLDMVYICEIGIDIKFSKTISKEYYHKYKDYFEKNFFKIFDADKKILHKIIKFYDEELSLKKRGMFSRNLSIFKDFLYVYKNVYGDYNLTKKFTEIDEKDKETYADKIGRFNSFIKKKYRFDFASFNPH